jgi:hemoglobin
MRFTILTATISAALFIGTLAIPAAAAQPKSLYERLGGMPAIRAVVDDLVSRILADDRVNRWFAHAANDPANAAAYKAALADFLCQGTGGPCKYGGPDMSAVHKGRGITSEAFDAVVEDLVATLNKLNVPAKEKSDVLAILKPMKTAIVETKAESHE